MVSTTEFKRLQQERNTLTKEVEELKSKLAEYEKCDSEESEESKDAPMEVNQNYKNY